MSTVDANFISEEGSKNVFLNPNKLINLLPNNGENEKFADDLLTEIIENFRKCIEEKQFFDSFNLNLKLLRRYVKTYNLRFSKEEHRFLIDTLYGALIERDIDVVVMMNVIVELKALLRSPHKVSRDELCLPWRPLYDLFRHHTHSSKAKNGILCSPKSVKEPLIEVIRLLSCFFPPETTEEVWLVARAHLHYPHPLHPDKHCGLKMLKLLLPFYYNNRESFFDIVWPHLTALLTTMTWNSKTEHDLMTIIARASATFPDLIACPPSLLDRVATSLLRSLKIKVSGCSKRTKFTGSKVYVEILVYAIHGPDDCEPIRRFRQLFQAIDHLFHPSSHNNHSTGRLLNLLYQISATLLTRYRNERVRKPAHSSFGTYPQQYNLTDAHIKNMVNIMLPSCEFAIFTKGKSDFGAVLSTVQKLGCLCPQVMVPACLKLFHETSGTVLEPHRALSTLATVSMLHIPLLNSVDRYPEGKLAVFPLMRQLITYININDPPKSYISIICFGNLANILWMEDLSDCAGDKALTPFEKEVALATTQFEDLVLQFFDKLFEIIDIGFSESEMVETQRNSDFRTETLIDALVMVIPNTSDAISQQVLDKTIDFVFSHSFLSEPIQQFFGAIFGCLLEREEISLGGLHRFMPQYMRYFRALVRDDCMIIHEKLDFKFVWLSSMLPDFIKSHLLPFIVDDVMEVLLALRRVGTFDSSKIIEMLLSYALNFCTHPSASLGIIGKLRDRDYHRDSWSGIITKADLCASARYRIEYKNPGAVEEGLVSRIMAEIIYPAIRRLGEITEIIGQNKEDRKVGNKELRSLCKVLVTVCECHTEYIVPAESHNDPRFVFGPEHGPLPEIATPPPPPRVLSVTVLPVLADIKAAARAALSAAIAHIATLPLPTSDLEELFQLLLRSHDLRGGAFFSGQNRSFLSRRFESFSHPLRRSGNTMLNWVLTVDDWHERRFRPRAQPLSQEVATLADALLAVVGLPHATLQRAASDCLYGLLAGHSQLDEYVMHRALLLCTATPLDEHLHRGLAGLLNRILEHKTAHESITFTYKAVAVFVALGRSPHVDVRGNRLLHSKMFDLLVQLMSFFTVLVPGATEANGVVVAARTRLYRACIDRCLDCYLDPLPPGDDAPAFARDNLACSLSSTTTWQSIYQMSIMLPLHVELPIPRRFLELFFLILFSPSKELSSQGCNQINIVVWLLKRNAARVTMSARELGLPESPLSATVCAGPRADNSFLAVETDTDYWELPAGAARATSPSAGYLWWPPQLKLAAASDGTAPSRHKDGLEGSNAECWDLLCRVFGSTEFYAQLETFLLDLGSQFLREEESCQAGASLLGSLHQFSVDHLVNSMIICTGPGLGLPLVDKLYRRLVTCSDSNQVYANRMAVQVLCGVLMSSKHWSPAESRAFYHSTLPGYLDLYLEHACKSELRLLGKNLIDLCVNDLVDVRHLLPAYRHWRQLLLSDLEHDSSKEAVCLYFLRCVVNQCGWRAGASFAEDLRALWRRFVQSPAERLRKEAGKVMRQLALLPLLSNQYFFCGAAVGEDRRQALLRFPAELAQLLAVQTRLVLSQKGLEPSAGTMRALRPPGGPLGTEPDLSDHEGEGEGSSLTSATETPPNEHETVPSAPSPSPSPLDDDDASPDKVVSGIVAALTAVFVDLDDFISEDLLRLFFICFDLVPVRDKMHIYTHVRHCAVMVANIFLSDEASLDDKRLRCCSLFSSLEGATQHRSWRVRLIAVKMLQIVTFNNFFVVLRAANLAGMVRVAHALIADPQIEVRKEAAVMLSGLFQCSMLSAPAPYVAGLCARVLVLVPRRPRPSQEALLRAHSGVLALCALIQAHPFDIPPELPEVLTMLCRHADQPEPICSTIRETLARFKKSHQDSWHLQRELFTEDQLCALTDVLVSPSYYA